MLISNHLLYDKSVCKRKLDTALQRFVSDHGQSIAYEYSHRRIRRICVDDCNCNS